MLASPLLVNVAISSELSSSNLMFYGAGAANSFFFFNLLMLDVELKREEILEKLQASQAEAQKVMDVIENPDVIAALRQDKLQNLQFLKDNYGVCIQRISCYKTDGETGIELRHQGQCDHFRTFDDDSNTELSFTDGLP